LSSSIAIPSFVRGPSMQQCCCQEWNWEGSSRPQHLISLGIHDSALALRSRSWNAGHDSCMLEYCLSQGKVCCRYGMLDPSLKDKEGLPLTIRAVFIIGEHQVKSHTEGSECLGLFVLEWLRCPQSLSEKTYKTYWRVECNCFTSPEPVTRDIPYRMQSDGKPSVCARMSQVLLVSHAADAEAGIMCRPRQEAEAVPELPCVCGPQHGRDRALRRRAAAVRQVLCCHSCQL
jgi:hypothetical protein